MNPVAAKLNPNHSVAFTLIRGAAGDRDFRDCAGGDQHGFLRRDAIAGENMTEALEEVLPTDRAVSVIKHDLAGIVPPGVLAGCDELGDTTVPGVAASRWALEIYTATGVIGPDAPFRRRAKGGLLPASSHEPHQLFRQGPCAEHNPQSPGH